MDDRTEPDYRYPDDGQILSQIAASNIDFKSNQFTATFLTTTYIGRFLKILL